MYIARFGYIITYFEFMWLAIIVVSYLKMKPYKSVNTPYCNVIHSYLAMEHWLQQIPLQLNKKG